jgi:hypothetical protein
MEKATDQGNLRLLYTWKNTEKGSLNSKYPWEKNGIYTIIITKKIKESLKLQFIQEDPRKIKSWNLIRRKSDLSCLMINSFYVQIQNLGTRFKKSHLKRNLFIYQ